MRTQLHLLSPALLLALALCACKDNYGKASTEAASASTTSQASKPGCNMEGMDHAKMSAEEHQKMMDECAKAKTGY